MYKPLVVIKLGGAALTDKTRIYSPNLRGIRSAARQVAAIQAKRSVLIVHGAGSYGHHPVKKYGLTEGFRRSTQLKGLSEAKVRLLEWELTLNRIFLQHKIPIVPFLPIDYVIARGGRIISCKLDPIKAWMSMGCVPSTGGDIVSDKSTRFSIVSGDQLAVYMARSLRAEMLVFATDVDGVFDSNPKLTPNARLIKNLSTSRARKVGVDMSTSVTDVTGGMRGKLEEAAKAASNGIPVYFVNLLKGNRLRDLVLGKHVVCSRVIPS